MKTLLMTATASIAILTASAADAALFDFTLTGTGISGAGTFLTTNTLVNGYYTIVGIAGSITFAGNVIPIDHLDAVNSYQGNDNLLSPVPTYLDGLGVSFTLSNPAATDVNIYYSGGYRYFRSGSANSAALTSFTLTPRVTAVPEPATWGLIAAGFGLTGMALRRRRTRVATALV